MDIQLYRNRILLFAWVGIALSGLGATILLSSRLEGYLYNSGPETIAFFISPFMAGIYFSLACILGAPTAKHFLGSLLLLLLGYLPLLIFWNAEYDLAYKSDNYLYLQAARQMLQDGSLNSSDNLLMEVKTGRHYLYQPGYKYYLAAILSTTGGTLTRQVQFLGVFIFFVSFLLMLREITLRPIEKGIRTASIIFFLLLVPAAVNNIMDGLTEGMFLSLLFLFVFSYFKRKHFLSAILLALLVFVRQYFLLAAIPLLLMIVLQARLRLPVVVIFILILMLPVYHNLYYAGEFRFFADYSWMTSKQQVGPDWFYESMIKPYKMIATYYIGIGDFSTRIILMGLMFVPLGFVLSLTMIYKLLRANIWLGLVFLLIVILQFWPTFSFMGVSGYPRFQLVNYSVLILSYFIVMENLSSISRLTGIQIKS